MSKKVTYSREPKDKDRYTASKDRAYTAFAGLYDWVVKRLPIWRNWIMQTVPHIRGERVLEVSFGTGYLLMQYGARFETCGIDYNEKMVATARENLASKGITAGLQNAAVESLPYGDETFDCIVNTMAFTGYPDGAKAMSELRRVLKKGGALVMVDVNYPADRNWLGMSAARLWASLGDIIRDMDELFTGFNFKHTDEEIGGFGSIHLYVAEKM